tara:strand:+ start:1559 stop:1969 length:411 start_codon:yes stop_codon:yes gene_type:complete
MLDLNTKIIKDLLKQGLTPKQIAKKYSVKYYVIYDLINKDEITLLMIKGYTMREISKKLNLTYTIVKKYINRYRRNTVPVHFDSKTIAYYNNEDDYLRVPEYNWESLDSYEKQAYYNYINKHKAYYESNARLDKNT